MSVTALVLTLRECHDRVTVSVGLRLDGIHKSGPYDVVVPSSRHAVYLHIGPPKTGTTYLQDVLWRNRGRLLTHGVAVPGRRSVDHFYAALDLRGIAFGGFDSPETAGAWRRLVHRTVRTDAPVAVISHEVFAGADEAHIARLVADLADTEVHVVYGTRDLARQLPAVWQESLKNRRTRPYETFLRRALGDGASSPGPGFWRAQDALSTLARWSGPVPPSRVHVVTLPPAGAAPDTLWRRLCRVLGIAADRYDLDVSRTNPSLSTGDAETLRRLNSALPAELPWPVYERRVKRTFNSRADAQRPGERLRVPPEYRDRVLELTERTQAGLKASGFDIVGDLRDLTPAESGFGALDPVSPDMVASAAVELLADVLSQGPGPERPAAGDAARTILRHLRRGRGTS